MYKIYFQLTKADIQFVDFELVHVISVCEMLTVEHRTTSFF